MQPTFRLRFLGTIHIERNGEPVRGFRSRKALAILGSLCVTAQRQPVPREQLAELFWEGQPEAEGRANLSWVLNKLNSLLPGCIQADRHTVQFQRNDQYWLDVDTFESLAAQREPAALAAAVELYRGEFMEGLNLEGCGEFSLWLVGERERWRQRAFQVLDGLIAHHARRGEYPQSLRFAQHLLSLEPWREETHRQVMRLLARSGQYSAALAQFEACRRTCVQELGLEPTEATTALYERIRAALSRRAPDHLPAQPTPFIGREKELAHVIDLLDNPDCRLLTITGPGGMGKTRLALQAAATRRVAFLEGIYFVSLVDASCLGSLATAIADALDLSFSGRDPQVQLVDYLREKQVLLILDSFEHLLPHTCAEEKESEEVLGGVRLLAEILQKAPEVKLLVTSRQRLDLSWEWCFEIEGLDYPTDQMAADARWQDYSAVRLFGQVAQQRLGQFSLSACEPAEIMRICRLVEGMPLAIELAAAWARTRTCAEIAREIESNLDFLATSLQDVPDRHKSIRAALEYSWRLLLPAEQEVLAKLSVFCRGFSPEAARDVADASQALLESLVNKSLVRCAPSRRYEMHELVRQYAAAKLAATPSAQSETCDRHSAYYAVCLHSLEADLVGANSARALSAIKAESENVCAAWQWATAHVKVKEIERGLNSLARFYLLAGPYQEGEAVIGMAAQRVRALVEQATQSAPGVQILLAKLLTGQARLQSRRGQHDQVIAAARQIADLARQASASDQATGVEATSYVLWGQALWNLGEHAAARAKLEQALALARAIQSPSLEADSLSNLGLVHWRLSEHDQARVCLEQARRIFDEIGDLRGIGRALGNLGTVCDQQGDHASAIVYFEQALRVLSGIGDRPGECTALSGIGLASNLLGDFTQAQACYQQALRISTEIGDRPSESVALINLGYVSEQQGDYAKAQAYYRQSLGAFQRVGDRRGASLALACLCLLFHHLGDDKTAREYGYKALLAQETGNRHIQGYALTRLGHALAGLKCWGEATETYRQALALRRELNQPNLALEPLAGLARVELAQGHLAQARVHVAEILERLAAGPPNGADEPARIYLTCYRVLRAAEEDALAQAVLSQGHSLLQERAARISDEALRRSFLENVAAHREIMQAVRSR